MVSLAAISLAAAASVTVAPGARYHAGALYGFFLGEHWRDAWTAPIEVPVLDLEEFAGGMRPVRLGGGFETKNLHFKSEDGRSWAFRSVDKDPTRALDAETRASLLGDLFQDETSTALPYGALIVPPLLEAAGVLHATPQLAVLPDSEKLGEYRKEFAGMLGLLEERIEHGLDGADKTAETLDLFQRLEEHSDERVDARGYLRARLIDVFVGDWDRHVLQWRWVRYQRDGERVWEPVPRDRDQAFSRFDGVLPSIAEYYTKQLAGFGAGYAPIDKLTFAGRYTDRRFLIPLDQPAWDAVTREVVASLTDEVISAAVRQLPAPVYQRSGAGLEQALHSRRDGLAAASAEYYRNLADQVDVRGTAGPEEFHVDRETDGAVSVAVYARDGEGKSAAEPFFQRRFRPGETSEIRLYTMGGDDRVLDEGDAKRAIRVRVVPPGPPVQAPLAERYETFRDWGSDALVYPQLAYDPTRGLVAGAILQRTGYGFELDPFSSKMNFAAAFSTGTRRPRLEYSAELRTRSPAQGLLYVAYDGMDTGKYYGQGNETIRGSLGPDNFNDVRQEVIVANSQVDVPLLGPLHGRAGLLFKHASDVSGAPIFAGRRPEGSAGMTLGSGELSLVMDTRDGVFPHQRGIRLQVTGRYAPEIFSNPAAFTKLRGEASAVYGGHFLTDVQASARIAGEKNWGSYPFFESAFLGGAASRLPLDVTGASTGNLLRGYDLNRFAGDASLVGNTELDAALARFSWALPFRFGVTALADVGRVFVAGESSSKWHAGYGGGLWLGVFAGGQDFQFASALKATVVHSDEGTSFYLFSGFTF